MSLLYPKNDIIVFNFLGPGYKTPLDAFRYGAREKILYVICINPEPKKRPTPDYLAVIDVDPSSSTYSQVSYDL